MGCAEGKQVKEVLKNTNPKKLLIESSLQFKETKPAQIKTSASTNKLYINLSIKNEGLEKLVIGKPISSPNLKKQPSQSTSLRSSRTDFTIRHESLVQERIDRAFNDEYQILNLIGKGSYGSVYRIKHNKYDIIRALKIVNKNKLRLQDADDDRSFIKEVEILAGLDHPHILKIFEYFFDGENYYIISEYLEGGELFDVIHKMDNYCENIAAHIMAQLFSAVQYLHNNNIVHRDIKPENIILSYSKEKGVFIKLIDFGTANFKQKGADFKATLGTPCYIAPEVITSSYNEKCDIWSLGVILYVILSGDQPFAGKENEEILKNVIKGVFSFSGKSWNGVSDEAKELIKKLLTYDPKERPSGAECIKDPWIKLNNPFKIKDYEFNVLFSSLNKYKSLPQLKKSTIAFIVHQLVSDKQIIHLRKVFQSIDLSGEGRLKVSDLYRTIELVRKKYISQGKTIVMSAEEVKDLISHSDNDFIDYEEFLRCTISLKSILTQANIELAFNYFDKDNSGFISINNLKEIFEINDETKQNEFIKETELGSDLVNGQGISLEAFSKYMFSHESF